MTPWGGSNETLGSHQKQAGHVASRSAESTDPTDPIQPTPGTRQFFLVHGSKSMGKTLRGKSLGKPSGKSLGKRMPQLGLWGSSSSA